MSVYCVAGVCFTGELYHHGIKGQKWGVRRFENPDGTLTDAGKKRYGSQENYENARNYKKARRNYNIAKAMHTLSPLSMNPALVLASGINRVSERRKYLDARKKYADTMRRDMKKDLDIEEIKKGLKKTAIAAGIVASAYGAVKINKLVEKGNAEWLKQGRENAEWVISAIGDGPVKAGFSEKAWNAAKYYSGKSNRKPFMLNA